MICPKCNHEIPAGGAFCPKCGFRLTQEKAPAAAVKAEPEKKNGNKGLLIGVIVAAAVVVCALLVVIVLLVNGKKEDVEKEPSGKQSTVKVDRAKEYDKALELLEQGEYAQAQEALTQLGDYEDAQNLAAYAAARLLLAQEKYKEAKEAFAALGSVRDASALAAQCQNEVTYQEAVAKKAAGEYAAAKELFAQIPGVRDADDQAADCRIQMANAEIAAAIGRKDWDSALDLLDSEDGKTYPDWSNVRQDCFNHANYDKAKAAMENKLYYTAYQMFSAMGNYQDAKSMAAMCQRPTPETGEMYRHPDHKLQACAQSLVNELKGGYSIYVRIYDAHDNVLVSSAFLRAGKSVVLFLPENTYRIKAAYGTGAWFGEREMFGDDAIYKDLGTSTRTKLNRWTIWRITFSDVLYGDTVNREDF